VSSSWSTFIQTEEIVAFQLPKWLSESETVLSTYTAYSAVLNSCRGLHFERTIKNLIFFVLME